MHKTENLAAEPFWFFFKQDLERHFVYHSKLSTLSKLKLCLTIDGVWAMCVYRFGRKLRTAPRKTGIRFLWPLYSVAETAIKIATGIHLNVDAQIGPGFYIGHFGGIYVGSGVKMGRNCSISQFCYVAANESAEAPSVGDRVYLGAGAKVIGPVTIGEDVAVGANAVVLDPIPSSAVAAGVPARVTSLRGSGDFIYLGENRDSAAASG
jgi:serine O-acetyltransferase